MTSDKLPTLNHSRQEWLQRFCSELSPQSCLSPICNKQTRAAPFWTGSLNNSSNMDINIYINYTCNRINYIATFLFLASVLSTFIVGSMKRDNCSKISYFLSSMKVLLTTIGKFRHKVSSVLNGSSEYAGKVRWKFLYEVNALFLELFSLKLPEHVQRRFDILLELRSRSSAVYFHRIFRYR